LCAEKFTHSLSLTSIGLIINQGLLINQIIAKIKVYFDRPIVRVILLVNDDSGKGELI
jgi:hypothetical protein